MARSVELLLTQDQQDRQQMLDMHRGEQHTQRHTTTPQQPSEPLKVQWGEHKEETEHSRLYDDDDDDEEEEEGGDAADEASEALEEVATAEEERKEAGEPTGEVDRAAAGRGRKAGAAEAKSKLRRAQRRPLSSAADGSAAARLADASAAPQPLSPSSPPATRVLMALSLLCCKFATENAPFNLRKSEIVKRKSSSTHATHTHAPHPPSHSTPAQQLPHCATDLSAVRFPHPDGARVTAGLPTAVQGQLHPLSRRRRGGTTSCSAVGVQRDSLEHSARSPSLRLSFITPQPASATSHHARVLRSVAVVLVSCRCAVCVCCCSCCRLLPLCSAARVVESCCCGASCVRLC